MTTCFNYPFERLHELILRFCKNYRDIYFVKT